MNAALIEISRTDRFGFRAVVMKYPSGLTLDVHDARNEKLATPEDIGYCRDDASGSFIVTWMKAPLKRQRIAVLPGVFFRVLSHLDKRTIANTISASKDELAAMGFIVEPRAKIYA